MCGICGFFGTPNGAAPEESVLVKMANTLTHRGPDASGYYLKDGAGFGFRRLSLIDLEGGNQPIFNEDNSIVLVCNGEIFNYQELRHELVQKGHCFRTRTDVEVLVHLYEEYGIEFLNQLNGQFAFAIHDKRRQMMFLARDHVGINPLYFTFIDGTFIFGSEIKAILAHPLVCREVDLTGLDQILSLPGLVSPRTMFKDIHSLPSGHYIIVKNQD